MKARIKDGAYVGVDFHEAKWTDDGTVFEVRELSKNGCDKPRFECVADGYGTKGAYGCGSLYTDKSNLLFVTDYVVATEKPRFTRIPIDHFVDFDGLAAEIYGRTGDRKTISEDNLDSSVLRMIATNDFEVTLIEKIMLHALRERKRLRDAT